MATATGCSPGRVLAGEHPGAIAVPDGIARTGTLVGCLLREQGFDAADALAVIDRKWQAMDKRTRHPHSPVTRGQITFVEEWPDVPRK